MLRRQHLTISIPKTINYHHSLPLLVSSSRLFNPPTPPGSTSGMTYRPIKSEDQVKAMQKLPKMRQILRHLPVSWKEAGKKFQREQFLDATRSPEKEALSVLDKDRSKRFRGLPSAQRTEKNKFIDEKRDQYLSSLGLKPKIRSGSSNDPENFVGAAPVDPLPDQPIARAVADQRLRICLVGSTNAGKSALWNKLCGNYEQSRGLPRNRTPQIVRDEPGLTRDATEAIGMVKDPSSGEESIFTLIDTPGCIDGEILYETAKAIESSHAVIFASAADNDISKEDFVLAKYLNSLQRIPVICVLTKSDLARHRLEEFRQHICENLNLGLPVPVSTYTEVGFEDLAKAIEPISDIQRRVRTWRDWAVEDAALSGDEAALEEVRLRNTRERPIRVAFIGRTRSGKSSLINCLLGQYRSRTRSDEAMTTRDTVETECIFRGRKLHLIDTTPSVRGSMRKKREFLNQLHNSMMRAIQFSDICVICFDARDGQPNKYDMALAYHCNDEGRPFIFAATHWDGVVDAAATAEAIDFKIKRQMTEVRYTHAVVTSCMPTHPNGESGDLLKGRESQKSTQPAVVGLNLALLMKEVLNLHHNWNKFVPAKDLTRFWRRLEKSTNIPMKNTRIHRIVQSHSRPPTFVLKLQSKDRDAYVRSPLQNLIRNALCEEFDFKGTPVRIVLDEKVKLPDITN